MHKLKSSFYLNNIEKVEPKFYRNSLLTLPAYNLFLLTK